MCTSTTIKWDDVFNCANMYDQKGQNCPKQQKDLEFIDKALKTGDLSIKQEHEVIHKLLKGKRGYNRKSFKSHGFCIQCLPTDLNKFDVLWLHNVEGELKNVWGHKDENCKNPPYCTFHCMLGHYPSKRCERYCPNCLMYGHTMQFCRKLKNCVLCGEKGT